MKKKLGIIGSINCIHLQRYLETIDRSLYQITVISCEPPSFTAIADEIFFMAIEQFCFFKTIQRLWSYFSFIKCRNFDIVHCFGALSPISWLGGIACSSILTVSVIGVDVFLEEQVRMIWPIKASIINLLRMADRVFYLSSAMKDKLIFTMKLSKDCLKEDFLSIDRKWRDYPNQNCSEDKAENDLIIFSPRILAPLYRQYELIQAIARVKLRHPNIRLIQTGYCQNLDYKEKCQHLAQDLGISNNIIFMEPLNKEEDLIGLYDKANLVVMIPISDGMPSSLVESWWRKKPVIVADIYNYNESWNGRFFIKTSVEPEKLSKCISDVLNSGNLQAYLTKSAFDFVSNKPFGLIERFEDIKIKRKNFRKFYELILFFIFLMEPHLSKIIKRLKLTSTILVQCFKKKNVIMHLKCLCKRKIN